MRACNRQDIYSKTYTLSQEAVCVSHTRFWTTQWRKGFQGHAADSQQPTPEGQHSRLTSAPRSPLTPAAAGPPHQTPPFSPSSPSHSPARGCHIRATQRPHWAYLSHHIRTQVCSDHLRAPPHPPPGTSDDGFRHLKLDLPAAQHTLVKTSVFVKSSTALKDCPADKLPEFAVIGRSNVGKSSLINALTQNDKLAKVSKEPGGLRGT